LIWHFCFSSKNKKLKGAKNSKEKTFLWAILMFFGASHRVKERRAMYERNNK